MTVKEAFNVAGLPTTWGNPKFRDWQPGFDALVVRRLKAAGAVILGKTNVPLMLEDWQSYNEIYGTTNNPWDLARTPGGSSGGAAAALAAGFVALELGSDIGGSLRCPAHFCGVFAHKPSLDLVPLHGAGPPHVPDVPIRSGLAVAGPMARSAADLALELDVIAGPDETTEGIGYKLALPPARHHDLKSFRVLVVDNHPLCPTAASVQAALDHLADRLGQIGAAVAHTSPMLPDLRRIDAAAMSNWSPQGVLRIFPLKSGSGSRMRQKNCPPMPTGLLPQDCTGFLRVIATGFWRTGRSDGRGSRSANCSNRSMCCYVRRCRPRHSRTIIRQDRQRHLDIDGKQVPYGHQIAWASVATVLGLPATVAPNGHSEEGLPIGVQIIGPYLEDRTTIAFAGLIEREFGGFVPPPAH